MWNMSNGALPMSKLCKTICMLQWIGHANMAVQTKFKNIGGSCYFGGAAFITELYPRHHFARYKAAEDATRKSHDELQRRKLKRRSQSRRSECAKSLRNDFEANFVGPNNILKQSPSHVADIDNFKQALKHDSKQKKPIDLTMGATNILFDPELKNNARNILSDPKLLLLQYYKANSVSTLDDVAQAAVKVNHHHGKKVPHLHVVNMLLYMLTLVAPTSSRQFTYC
ncbi:hypothetical protein ACFE04_011363 [Oxalis oulophora]